MAFQILPCAAVDAPDLSKTMMHARFTDPHWMAHWTPTTTREAIISNTAARLPHALSTGRKTKRHQKAVCTATGQIVAYARWILPEHLAAQGDVWLDAQAPEASEEEVRKYEKMSVESSDERGRPKGMKDGAMNAFRSAPLEAADARVMKGGPFLTLDYLTTDPEFWRRGVGSMLVRSGLDVADELKIKTYVMSEPAALKLYLNCGFQLIETVTTEYPQYGGTEPMVHYFLVRDPVL